MYRIHRNHALAALLFALSSSTCLADSQTITWIGGNTAGDWALASKWSLNTVPNNNASTTFNVLIDGGNAAPADVRITAPEFGSTSYIVDSLTIDAGDRLTFPDIWGGPGYLTALNGATINGTVQIPDGSLNVGSNQSLLGSGTLELGSFGAVASTAGSLTLGPALSVRCVFDPYAMGHASIGKTGQPLVNYAPISVDVHGVLTLSGSTISNLGSLTASNGGIIAINTTFSQFSDLGSWSNNGGRFRIAGTLDNTGRTFALSRATGDWELTGTMRNGTLTTTDGCTFYIPDSTSSDHPAILDNVQINGSLAVAGTTSYDYSGFLLLPAGQALSGTGTVLLKGLGEIKSAGGTFVISPGITIHGGDNRLSDFYGIGDVTRPTTNQGRIVADIPGYLNVRGNPIVNTGILEVTNGCNLGLCGTFTRAGLGTLVYNGGAFCIKGTLDNTGQVFRIDNTNPAWFLSGTIKNGSIETADGKQLRVISDDWNNFPTAILDNVAVNGSIRLIDGLKIPAGQSLHGTGEVVLAGGGVSSDGALTIGPALTARGRGTIRANGALTITQGLISVDPEMTITITGTTVTNLGKFQIPSSSRLVAQGNVVFGDNGALDLELGSNSTTSIFAITGNLDLSGPNDWCNFSLTQPGLGPKVFLTYTGTLSGIFDHVTPGFTVDYSIPHQISVTVPEPRFLPLWLIASAALLVRRRRSQHQA
jgi:hypothetical protein